MTSRRLETLLTAQPASDGAGVKLHRIVGPDGMRGLDPFLLLDEFASDSAADYIAGFPSHPHRGFETVTYMLAGAMLHRGPPRQPRSPVCGWSPVDDRRARGHPL